MCMIDRNRSKDLINSIIEEHEKLKKDMRYKYETDPASYFVDYLENEMGFTFKEKITNEKDPPDFILKTDDKIINLEVTCLINRLIPERNKFFKKVEGFINEILEKYLKQNGKYEIFYIPGDNYTKIGNSMKITKPDYRNTISKPDFEKLIEKDIKTQLEGINYIKKLEIKLHNKKQQVYGQVILNKISESQQVEFFIQPQGIFRLDNWESDEFRKKLQKIINLKQLKCRKNIEKYEGKWWLIISDIDDEMNTWHLGFDIKELKFTSNFFDKIFFLSKSGVDCKFYELPII